MMNEAQVREYLGGVSRERIRQLRIRGVLVPVVLGDKSKAVRYDRHQVDAALDLLTRQAQAKK
jgi:hypothetical protein